MKTQMLYLDPAWDYENNKNDQKTREFHEYPKMTLADLCNLPVPDLLDRSGVCFCWYTGPMARDCMIMMESWDFKVVNWFAFVWVKLNPSAVMLDAPDQDLFGVQGGLYGYGAGGYSVTNIEAVCVARHRKNTRLIERVDATQRQLVFSRIGNRSRKPDEVRSRIERMFGMPQRGIVGVELFATQVVPGWVSLGYEIDGRDLRETIPELIGRDEVNYGAARDIQAAVAAD